MLVSSVPSGTSNYNIVCYCVKVNCYYNYLCGNNITLYSNWHWLLPFFLGNFLNIKWYYCISNSVRKTWGLNINITMINNNDNNNLQGDLNKVQGGLDKKRKYEDSSDEEERKEKKPNLNSLKEEEREEKKSNPDSSDDEFSGEDLSNHSGDNNPPGSSSPRPSSSRDTNHPILGPVYRFIERYNDAVRRNDEHAINESRHGVRNAREALMKKVSRLEDKDENGESIETRQYRHALVSADYAICEVGLEAVLDDVFGNPDFFVADPTIYDDVE